MSHRDQPSAITIPIHEHRDDAEMFDLAPVSLWLEDYSGVKALFEEWRHAGVTSLREHLRADPARIKTCAERMRVVKVNRRTLTLFEAADVPDLVDNFGLILRDEMFESYVGELVQLWDGRQEFFSQTVNYTLSGRRLDLQLKGSILPGYEGAGDGAARRRGHRGQDPQADRRQQPVLSGTDAQPVDGRRRQLAG